MLYWTALFFVIALVAAVFGFGGIAAQAAGVAKILFIVFLVFAGISLLFGCGGRRSESDGREASQPRRRWSQKVTETSNALDLEPGVFRKRTPRAIALSLKRSADGSRRRKTDSFRSAMSMLTFYVNRAGKGLSAERLQVLDAAKDELRAAYGR